VTKELRKNKAKGVLTVETWVGGGKKRDMRSDTVGGYKNSHFI